MTFISMRYEVLQPLGTGTMGAVFLVHDKLRGENVALKQVLRAEDAKRLAVIREFRTLSALRHPNIVSVIEYGTYEGQPYFTMEYLPDAVPFDTAESPFDQTIGRMIQLLQALGYLHQRGILHRDLKPANVLITRDSQVKVLDFGLAQEISGTDGEREGLLGTFSYLSPELFSGQLASPASDFWALGVMFCEALAHHHPFEIDGGFARLFQSITMRAPNLDGINERLFPVLRCLLAKEPYDRYATAFDVISDLCAAVGIDMPPESQAQREGFLQSAAFVGREAEYQTLTQALTQSAGGSRQMWLIGGEVGVGKSRLLEEVRTRALVDGFIVLQGQDVEGGGLPLQLWRDPARRLVLGAPISDLTASVLKALVPDITTLLGREIPALPTLDPKANRDRVLTALLGRIRAQESPVLLILEDLQWANESLELLKLLLPYLENLPVMIIGSYRSDEAPNLPDVFPEAYVLRLERLTLDAVAALSRSMIGTEAVTPELVERLVRETEGNALFMVEVVRALAEAVGGLHEIKRSILPNTILAGGMTAVLRRRLAKVPAWALDTLKLAAVIERVIDLPVLREAGIENPEKWLQACADASVLEPYQGVWRFSHDRLREVLLADLKPHETAALHEWAARALEAVHPDDVQYAERLAHHWHNVNAPERELSYIVKAAKYLVETTGEYARAERLTQRGLELDVPELHAEVMHWYGYAIEKQGRFAEAAPYFHNALRLNPPPALMTALFVRVGSLLWLSGRYAEAQEYGERALTTAETLPDKELLVDVIGFLGNVAYETGDYAMAIRFFERAVHVARESGEQAGLSANLLNLGNLAAAQGNFHAATTYYNEGLRIGRARGHRFVEANALIALGIVEVDRGAYESARDYLEAGLRMSRDLRDPQSTVFSLNNLGRLATIQGRLAEAAALYQESLYICREIDYRYVLVYAAVGAAIALILMHETASARDALLEAVRITREQGTLPLTAITLLGAAYWQYAHGRYKTVARQLEWMARQAEADIMTDARFQKIMTDVRAVLGDAAFEQHTPFDPQAALDSLLEELGYWGEPSA